MAKAPILVLGFGGNAIDAIETIESSYEIIGFVDDDSKRQQLVCDDIPVYPRAILEKYKDTKVITLIGSDTTIRNRRNIISNFNVPYSRFATIIHPAAIVSKRTTLGHDVIVFAGAVVAANVVVGNHIFVLPNSVIHHDVCIGDYSLIGANVTIAGHVSVGESCYIGSASSIRSNISIGEGTIIGMAANVLHSVVPRSTMVGNPARAI